MNVKKQMINYRGELANASRLAFGRLSTRRRKKDEEEEEEEKKKTEQI